MGVPAMPRLFGGARGCDDGAQGDGHGAQCDGQARHVQGLLALCLCLVRWRDEQVRLGRRPDENRRESFGCVIYIVCAVCRTPPNGNVNRMPDIRSSTDEALSDQARMRRVSSQYIEYQLLSNRVPTHAT